MLGIMITCFYICLILLLERYYIKYYKTIPIIYEDQRIR
jgi:hypothetical protein